MIRIHGDHFNDNIRHNIPEVDLKAFNWDIGESAGLEEIIPTRNDFYAGPSNHATFLQRPHLLPQPDPYFLLQADPFLKQAKPI
ncbi:MAG: hypothetical protein HYY52_06570 [Candidatus Melainabacteria bacterium]|nr:hypothetical protein [Candidatus Melainabacteria bacterium]